jgi:hypothetical protein
MNEIMTLPRDLKPGDEVFTGSSWRTVAKVEKIPARKSIPVNSPARYKVWWEGWGGITDLLTPGVRVPVRKLELSEQELDMLRSYADGPRIWDAAVLVPVVFALADRGLTEPVHGRSGVYQLTDRGREVLAAMPETVQ